MSNVSLWGNGWYYSLKLLLWLNRIDLKKMVNTGLYNGSSTFINFQAYRKSVVIYEANVLTISIFSFTCSALHNAASTGSNHLNFLRITFAWRKYHSDSFSPSYFLEQTPERMLSRTNINHVKCSIHCSRPYPCNLHFLLYHFFVHTNASLTNPLPLVALEPWIEWTLIKKTYGW